MDEERKTGLGGSLLLRRTETPQAPEHSNVSTSETSASPGTPTPTAETFKRPKRPIATDIRKSSKKGVEQVLRDRCTLYIDRDVNERLDLAARVEGRERSEVVSQLLRKHLPKYRIETQD